MSICQILPADTTYSYCCSFILYPERRTLRLVGPSPCSGRVEVFYNNRWGTVCDDNWSLSTAGVVCRELECGTAVEVKASAFFGQGEGNIWLDDVQCTGQEPSIFQCEHKPFGTNNCGHGEDVGVICSGQSEFSYLPELTNLKASGVTSKCIIITAFWWPPFLFDLQPPNWCSTSLTFKSLKTLLFGEYWYCWSGVSKFNTNPRAYTLIFIFFFFSLPLF